MKFYNTLNRNVEEFQPPNKGPIKLYTCGPTVYDYAHLGNLRAYVFTDTLRRALEVNHYKVKHVMNITDVGHLASDADEGEDKLEKGAEREHKTVWEVADFFIEAFKKDVSQLNILPPNGYSGSQDEYARATDPKFIEQGIEIVRLLLEKGFAYKTEQAIYFDVRKLPSYGELSGQKLDEKETAARENVVTDENKKHPQDFAVWFFAVGRFADHTMRWDSPWGEGFPGWHLECSSIIHATLGEPVDIHTGGVDHIGTHHPNEMAQTEAAFEVKLSKFWLHNEHMLVEGQKMSKSLGNIFTLDDVIKKGFDPLALRLLYLQSHYRSQSNFTWAALEAAQNRLQRWRNFAVRRFQHIAHSAGSFNPHMLMAPSEVLLPALQDDLDTPTVLTKIDEYIDKVEGEDLSHESWMMDSYLDFIDKSLGLKLAQEEDIGVEQKKIIREREEARRLKDWNRADELRNRLLDQGIELNDSATGPIWSRGRGF